MADDGESPSVRNGVAPSAPEPGHWISPVVGRLLTRHRLDPAMIEGTGRHGRLTRADVLAHLDATRAGAAGVWPSGDAETIPFSRIRRLTAEHMVRSLATAAHTLVVVDVDFGAVEAARETHKAQFRAEEGFGLSYLPFVARAVIDAVEEYPHLNGTVDGDSLVVHRGVGLGVAVDLDFEGLVVPVVRQADQLRLRPIARAIDDLSARARSKRLSADDLVGGTFTVTNAGGYGTFITGPIINQPQVAILSTDSVRMRPVAVPAGDDWAVAVHPVGNLALSFDHRAFDGAYASAFLARVRDILERREWGGEL